MKNQFLFLYVRACVRVCVCVCVCVCKCMLVLHPIIFHFIGCRAQGIYSEYKTDKVELAD